MNFLLYFNRKSLFCQRKLVFVLWKDILMGPGIATHRFSEVRCLETIRRIE